LELEEVLARPASVVAEHVAVPPSPARRFVVGALAGLLLGAVVMTMVARVLWKPGAVARPVARFAVPVGAIEGLFPRNSPQVAISRDGSKVAYAALRVRDVGRLPGPEATHDLSLYLRPIDQQEPKAIPDVVGIVPFFSPDGRWLGFWDGL